MQTGFPNPSVQTEEEVLEHLLACFRETTEETAIYLRIASVLSEKIAEGYFEAGAWLPSHRSLAKTFDVNLTTVTKSLNHLKEKGIISSRAGKGTIVRGRALDHTPPSYDVPEDPPEIDLSIHSQTLASVDRILKDGTKEVVASVASELFRYYPATGDRHTIGTAHKWLSSQGFEVAGGNVAVTAGAQHALLIAMASCMRRGDIMLAPRLVYQGVKSAAKMLDFGVSPVETDSEGVVPNSLERALRNPRVKSIFLMSNFDNPTGVTLSEKRKADIAGIAKRHSLILIEDDIYQLLAPNGLSSLYSHYPEGTFYFSSLSKVISPGCRFGYLVYPPAFANAVAAASRGSIWMPDRFSLSLARWLVENDCGERIISLVRESYKTRHAMALSILGTKVQEIKPESNVIWLPLETSAQASLLKDRLSARGVGVSDSAVFKIGNSEDSNGIRIYKSSARTDEEWKIALRTIAKQLALVVR